MRNRFYPLWIAYNYYKMWTQKQLNEYDESGFSFIPGLLTSEETLELNEAVALLMDGKDGEDLMHREREKTGAVRQGGKGLLMCHFKSYPFMQMFDAVFGSIIGFIKFNYTIEGSVLSLNSFRICLPIL